MKPPWHTYTVGLHCSTGPIYCAFNKHTKSEVQSPPSQLHFLRPVIIIMITSNEPYNTETHKTDWNPPITDHKPWPFEPVYVKFCFLIRGPLGWLTAAKNVNISWLMNFRVRVYLKSAVNSLALDGRHLIWCFWLQVRTCTLYNVSKFSF